MDCKWSTWSGCSETCGTGYRNRTIDIQAKNGGKNCTGSDRDICNTNPCPGMKYIISILYSVKMFQCNVPIHY